jgi:nicotinate-nucleotide pyrophosphorylase (carboxylating)
VLAGLEVAKSVFRTLDSKVVFRHDYTDGDRVKSGDLILTIEGRLRFLLIGERTALNFLQHLSGIATCVREYVDALKGQKVRLVDTRKTLPGFRVLDKYAVRVGGARNHRMGLYDGVLIKDNHIAAIGGITAAIESVRKGVSHLHKIEIEVSDQSGVEEAIAAGADVIMLDNMNVEQVEAAVKLIDGKATVEVSGGVNKDNLGRLARTGVDLISVGALTHSAGNVDISMRLDSGR